MKKAKWPKLPTLLVPLFECARVYLSTSRDEWYRIYAALGLEPENISDLGGCVRLIENTESGDVIILLGVFTGDLHVLAHECAHVAFRICSLCGVEINPDGSNETYCYLLGNIFRFAEEHVKKPVGVQPV
ncbi:TPA: hypothetical protein G5T75_003397 [Salmonella enterica]|uniref:Uncharacterized protein n=1 Tax=Salmonella enterica TaxID=28901 RepID=A0A754B5I9_SALER|nr:hypothetical protein [Salmonella enterica]ECU9162065.1 hypothetical protein [Salmonella enterica subsp. enterica serovar Newport str. CFSAN000599]EDU1194308.1 hypothetical protein [Salmonella enterica subsp. enterica serovar Heidelberg str. CFSAN000576]HAF8579453.1 hypothetical protein [Salmonella enterica]